LAIDRPEAKPAYQPRRHLLTRYVLPLTLLLGFLSLVAWAARDFVIPPRAVIVAPVYSTRSPARQEGEVLFNAAGWIEPRPTPVRVAALAPGVVEQLLVVEDQPVKAGEPIAKLVTDDAKLAHDGALADLKLREAELEEAAASLIAAKTRLKFPVHLEAALGEAEASLAKIATQLQNLPFETRRAEADRNADQKVLEAKVAAEGVVAAVEIEIAKSKVESAEALVAELRDRAKSLAAERMALAQRRDALKKQLDLLADEIRDRDEAAAKVKGAAARVELARVVVAETALRLDRMTVRSPIDGRVFRLVGHQGARIGSGMTQMVGHDGSTIVTLYRPNRLQVRVDVRFEDVPHLRSNPDVVINNPALSTPLAGKVLFLSSEADNQKNTLQVKVAIPDPPPVFKPEMLVDVTFLASKTSALNQPSDELRIYVPERLVQRDDDGSFVWLADQAARVARKAAVKTGMTAPNGLLEITSGLTVSSRIIVSGGEGLRHGDRLIVTGEDATLGADDAGPVPKATPQNRLP
jgi:RND family efflux transporter MFP subunit